ncbi:23768_t:CDS:1 [Cetraspora pellucida]|uniref:23768_t:CDS:1 n=1 Tax=Cetraspora pellucida TaxID=1433469 RepID=A0A9N9EW03_9GLOM|nr:23768_t:CDS:1 [Cetraspora pellucida]
MPQFTQLRTEDGWKYVTGCECDRCLEHSPQYLPQDLNQVRPIRQNSFEIISYQHPHPHLFYQHSFQNQQLNFHQRPPFKQHQSLLQPSINQHQLLQPNPNIQYQPLLQPNEHPQIINNQSTIIHLSKILRCIILLALKIFFVLSPKDKRDFNHFQKLNTILIAMFFENV